MVFGVCVCVYRIPEENQCVYVCVCEYIYIYIGCPPWGGLKIRCYHVKDNCPGSG